MDEYFSAKAKADVEEMIGEFIAIYKERILAQDWMSAELGLNWTIGDTVTAYAAYTGRFSDDLQERNSFSLGLRVGF